MEDELLQCDKAFEFEEDSNTIEKLAKRYEQLSARINNTKLQQLNLENQLSKLSGVKIFEEKTVNKFQEKISETSEMIKEKLGNFDVSSDPIERMQQEINITDTKLDLLQKKWQELSSAEPSDKITAQIAATEQKIISLSRKLEGLNASLKWYSDETITTAYSVTNDFYSHYKLSKSDVYGTAHAKKTKSVTLTIDGVIYKGTLTEK